MGKHTPPLPTLTNEHVGLALMLSAIGLRRNAMGDKTQCCTSKLISDSIGRGGSRSAALGLHGPH